MEAGRHFVSGTGRNSAMRTALMLAKPDDEPDLFDGFDERKRPPTEAASLPARNKNRELCSRSENYGYPSIFSSSEPPVYMRHPGTSDPSGYRKYCLCLTSFLAGLHRLPMRTR